MKYHIGQIKHCMPFLSKYAKNRKKHKLFNLYTLYKRNSLLIVNSRLDIECAFSSSVLFVINETTKGRHCDNEIVGMPVYNISQLALVDV